MYRKVQITEDWSAGAISACCTKHFVAIKFDLSYRSKIQMVSVKLPVLESGLKYYLL